MADSSHDDGGKTRRILLGVAAGGVTALAMGTLLFVFVHQQPDQFPTEAGTVPPSTLPAVRPSAAAAPSKPEPALREAVENGGTAPLPPPPDLTDSTALRPIVAKRPKAPPPAEQKPAAPPADPRPPQAAPPLDDDETAIDGPTRALVEENVRLLRRPEPRERIKGLQGLAALGQKAESAARAICQATLDPVPKVYTAALDTLAKVRPDLHPSVLVLRVDNNSQNVVGALSAIGAMRERGNAAVPVVVSVIERDGGRGGLECLRSISRDDPSILPMLLSWTRDSHIRPFVIPHLGDLGAARPELRRKIMPVLAADLASSLATARLAAIHELARFGSDASGYLPTLRKLRFDADAGVRQAAEVAIPAIEKSG